MDKTEFSEKFLPLHQPSKARISRNPTEKVSKTDEDPAVPTSLRTGAAIICSYLPTLPAHAPGVYRMLDEFGQVLYVGKARNLVNRVTSYSRTKGHSSRIARMIAQTRSMEFVITRTETEALLLEANLIKKFAPPFNVLLRDDKSYAYLLIRKDHDYPRLVKHRGSKKIKGDYFGPFASAAAVNRTLNILQKAFLLRNCTDSEFEVRSRPCLQYQIKRCSAPCVKLASRNEYGQLVTQTRDFLTGKSEAIRTELASQMEAAAEELAFEKAAGLRDRIRALSELRASQSADGLGELDADIFALIRKDGRSCVEVFFFRSGQNWGNQAYFPRHDKEEDSGVLLESFIGQFYDNKPCPQEILVSHKLPEQELLASALSEKFARKIKLYTPQRGGKYDLVKLAKRNASEALARSLANSTAQKRLRGQLQEKFDLSKSPDRIEVYDNSHIQGAHAVGAMIVAGEEGFEPKEYRLFNMKDEQLEPGDDYAMMREMLRRRLTRLKTDLAALSGEVTRLKNWPDLLLIDGGRGQLSAVLEVVSELEMQDLPLQIIAVAKGEERNAGREEFYFEGRAPIGLAENDELLYYLQRLRDEAHRFAITRHRAKRSRQLSENPLDSIEGVGKARKKALLHHFGSARAVSRARRGDIEKVPGISRQLAARIFDFFQQSVSVKE